jgi:hypothetical protein
VDDLLLLVLVLLLARCTLSDAPSFASAAASQLKPSKFILTHNQPGRINRCCA